jgi:hypothetical protein
MRVQTAALTFALHLYPFHAVNKRETTGRIVSRAFPSTYTSPEHNAEMYHYRTSYIGAVTRVNVDHRESVLINTSLVTG